MYALRCIQYLSDLHLEFYKGSLPKVDRLLRQIVPIAPLCILAGDIGYPFEETYRYFLEGMSQKFEHIVLIHGNHEYYQYGRNKGKSMEEIVEQTRAVCMELPRVHFLHNETWDYLDVRFIGSVLWSELKDPQRLVNDSRAIGEFSVPVWNELHATHKEWIDGALRQAEADKKRAIVVTHHLPSMSLIAEKWKNLGEFNQCFASACDALLRSPAVFWIYGHTHEAGNTVLQGVQCVANPIGYPGENPKPNYNAFLPLP